MLSTAHKASALLPSIQEAWPQVGPPSMPAASRWFVKAVLECLKWNLHPVVQGHTLAWRALQLACMAKDEIIQAL